MFRHYLLITFRNLFRYKSDTIVNLVGLSIGLTCCFLITFYIQCEFRYNRNLPNADHIYKIIRETTLESDNRQFCERTSGPLGRVLEEQFPEIKRSATIFRRDTWVKKETLSFPMTVAETSTDITQFFNLTLLGGYIKKGVPFARTALITQSSAQKLFGSQNPIGQIIQINHMEVGDQYEVVGIIADLPTTSTLQFDILSIFIPAADNWHWNTWITTGWLTSETYIQVLDKTSIPALKEKIQSVFSRYIGEDIAHTNRYHLQPWKDIYLYSVSRYNISKAGYGSTGMVYGNIETIYILTTIALIILLIACANFVNLSTSKALNRAGEVGIRKVVGAYRGTLICQFLIEPIFLFILSAIIASGLTEILLPGVSTFIGKPLIFDNKLWVIPVLGLTTILLGFLSGAYPALQLSGFDPVKALRGKHTFANKGSVRKILVIGQFSISISLIAITFIIMGQLNYLQGKTLGFNKKHILVLPIFLAARDIKDYGYDGLQLKHRYNSVKQQFLEHPNITAASTSRFLLGGWSTKGRFESEGSGDKTMFLFPVDEDFITTFNISLLAGSNFTRTHAELNFEEREAQNLLEQFIVNETAVRQLGLQDPIGKQLIWHNGRSGTIIGVVKNFHFESLKKSIEPLVLITQQRRLKFLFLKIELGNFDQTLDFIQKKWTQFIPNRPLEYSFLDDDLNALYRSETTLQNTLYAFSGLAIFLSSLGLFGLASFMMNRRQKEIGIRKVLGASMIDIVVLFLREYIGLLIVASLIAMPVAYYATTLWLQNFAYRISSHPIYFILAGVFALSIALATISYQTIRAAHTSPAHTLRTE